MQELQSEIEFLSSQNSILEQEFENEIGKKNKNSKELGQIINSINNINYICNEQQMRTRKKVKNPENEKQLNEDTPKLIEELSKKLEFSETVVQELVEVYKEYALPYDYNQEKAYQTENDLEFAMEAAQN